MKKIFAIALALVMVLSMASAFASPCTTGFDWTCATTDTNCGKATVEVIPYVKTNAACNGSEFVESDCAAAINGEHAYYAIKLTVDEDVDLEWWKKVKFELDVEGMAKNFDKLTVGRPAKLGKDESKDGWVFYLVYSAKDAAWGWSSEVTEDDNFKLANVMNKSTVKEYAKAKVCVTLKSASKGTAGTVGDYWVEYSEVVSVVEPTQGQLMDAVGKTVYDAYKHANDKTTDAYKLARKAVLAAKEELTYEDVTCFLKVFDEKDGKLLVTYTIKDGKIGKIDYTAHCGEAAYATIKDFFGLEIGTCVDAKIVAANFGWDDKVKSCFAWKTQNATAIVDAECVVAIPKTGDASVLAWLF